MLVFMMAPCLRVRVKLSYHHTGYVMAQERMDSKADRRRKNVYYVYKLLFI